MFLKWLRLRKNNVSLWFLLWVFLMVFFRCVMKKLWLVNFVSVLCVVRWCRCCFVCLILVILVNDNIMLLGVGLVW